MSKELEFRESDYSWDNGYHGGYDGLVESCGNVVEIKQSWSIGSYQGDYVYLIEGDDGKIGFVVQGYGSCSGCDALEACDTRQDVESLRDGICDSIQWFDSVREVYAYITDPEANRWYWYESEWEGVKRDISELVEPEVEKAA